MTHFALQDAMKEIEGGAGCYLYPCGVDFTGTLIRLHIGLENVEDLAVGLVRI